MKAAAVAVFALVSLVSFSVGKDTIKCYSSDPDTGKQKRVYTIAHGFDWGAYEYLDSGGFVRGLMLDLIIEVCAAAGIDCLSVWEPYTNCVQSLAGQHMRGGEGLMKGWYDGCIGWAVSVSRTAFFKFSESFLKASRASFYVKADTTIDVNNFNKYRIGFMDGWVDDEKCLARLTDKVLPANQIFYYKNSVELKNAILSGEVHAGHIEEGVLETYITGMANPLLKRVGPWRTCVLRGDALMTALDSDLPAAWNTGFEKLVSSGRFADLCRMANQTHNADGKGIINCV